MLVHLKFSSENVKKNTQFKKNQEREIAQQLFCIILTNLHFSLYAGGYVVMLFSTKTKQR